MLFGTGYDLLVVFGGADARLAHGRVGMVWLRRLLRVRGTALGEPLRLHLFYYI